MSEVIIDESKLTKLNGQVVFITGGAQGLGFAAAKVFRRLGSKVIIGDIQIPETREPGFDYLQCDITDWSSLSMAMKTTVDRYGSLDVFIANAGIGEVEDFFHDDLDEKGNLKPPRHSVVEVNLKGTMNCIKFAIHYMRKQPKGGAIVVTASSAGYMAEKKIPAYAATKHGVCMSLRKPSRHLTFKQIIGLLRCLTPSVHQYNITINAVAPWMTESNLLMDVHRRILAETGVELNDPDNVGKAMAYLAGSGVNGLSLWCGRNIFAEIEGPMTELRPQWLGEENARLWSKANQQDFFSNQSGL
jgi:NAD(P)-dependent dehydrogenase (short-subunit alcohol dehydrogenase family)